MDADGLDTGRGFEYFKRTVVPGARILRKWSSAILLDELQEACGLDGACGGFTTSGYLLTHELQENADTWKIADNPTDGLYRKKSLVAECQRSLDCSNSKVSPVCHKATHRTFQSACEAKVYH